MARWLVMTIRLFDGQYHGMGEPLPSPGRLFQALVAGAAKGYRIEESSINALRSLESLGPPTIGLPVMTVGQQLKVFGPDNDLDSVDGDLSNIGKIRSSKAIEPKFFDSSVPLLYTWPLDDAGSSDNDVKVICTLAERLYQFGRGVDMAWACGELLDKGELDARLSGYRGVIYRPTGGAGGTSLACPAPGSLESLRTRYAANSHRFTTVGLGKTARQLFSQPPKPRFMQVLYESPPSRAVYELRENSSKAPFSTWPLVHASKLVVCLRDGAVARLQQALPDLGAEIERCLVGRKATGADEGPISSRVKIVPLASIGHEHADHGIRRVLVEVPGDCPLRSADVHWAFSGLDLSDPETGEVLDKVLTSAVSEDMLFHYGVADRSFRTWRTVTPAALPESAKRRRIDPARQSEEAKGGKERAMEQAQAATAVTQALRHAEVRARAETIRVQREPFEAKGERVEPFAAGTRFAKERLWHVEIVFDKPVSGPLVIGDGRFLGLGVMAPQQQAQGIYAYTVVEGMAQSPAPIELARALRRAVMARVQDVLGKYTHLSAFFMGHERDGAPTRGGHSHLTFLFDPPTSRLMVVAPHVIDQRVPRREESGLLALLDAALAGFEELRAGQAGLLKLCPTSIATDRDRLFAPSRIWETVTPYQVTRHTKDVGAAGAFAADLRAECRRCGLPEPSVTPRELRGIAGIGLIGDARLAFKVAVEGPITLGRSRHFGGGLFAGLARRPGDEEPPCTSAPTNP